MPDLTVSSVVDTFMQSANTTGMRTALGFTNFVPALSTASPNNTVNAAQLYLSGGSTNVDLALTPKGTGAFIVGAAPNSAAAGGNKRGNYAVDLQIQRNNAAYIASGANSALLGGYNNTAGGQYSAILGGSTNTANGNSAIVLGGQQNSAAGQGGVSCGSYGAATGANSFAHNSTCAGTNAAGFVASFATGDYSFAAGSNATADGSYGIALGSNTNVTVAGSYGAAIGYNTYSSAEKAIGLGNSASGNRFAILTHSSGPVSYGVGDSQSVVSWTGAAEVYSSGSPSFQEMWVGNNYGQRFIIPTGFICSFFVRIVAHSSDKSQVNEYWRRVRIKNVSATTSLVGSVETIGTDYVDNATPTFQITADDTNDALKIEVKGTTDSTWYFTARIDGVEMKGGYF